EHALLVVAAGRLGGRTATAHTMSGPGPARAHQGPTENHGADGRARDPPPSPHRTPPESVGQPPMWVRQPSRYRPNGRSRGRPRRDQHGSFTGRDRANPMALSAQAVTVGGRRRRGPPRTATRRAASPPRPPPPTPAPARPTGPG